MLNMTEERISLVYSSVIDWLKYSWKFVKAKVIVQCWILQIFLDGRISSSFLKNTIMGPTSLRIFIWVLSNMCLFHDFSGYYQAHYLHFFTKSFSLCIYKNVSPDFNCLLFEYFLQGKRLKLRSKYGNKCQFNCLY